MVIFFGKFFCGNSAKTLFFFEKNFSSKFRQSHIFFLKKQIPSKTSLFLQKKKHFLEFHENNTFFFFKKFSLIVHKILSENRRDQKNIFLDQTKRLTSIHDFVTQKS